MTDRDLGIDPETLFELKIASQQIIQPPVDRNFGDDSDKEFVEAQTVVPSKVEFKPGETAVAAHVRIQRGSV